MTRDSMLLWLLYSDKIGAQVAVILSALLWTIGLLMPSETMAQPRYAFMAAFGNDYGWAFAFFASLCLQTLGLIGRNRLVLLAAGSWAVVIHGLAAYNFVALNWPHSVPVAVASEIAIALTAAICYIFVPPSRANGSRV